MSGEPEPIEPERENAIGDPVPKDIAALAWLLDDQFKIPGTQLRFGIDGFLGLIPGIGDTLSAGLGGYIVVRAHQLGAPKLLIARMLTNLTLDWVVGLVPVVGDLLDVAYKAHQQNVRLLRDFLATRPPGDAVDVAGERVG